MKPRRILIFSHAYYPRLVGGAEVAVKEITDRIPAGEVEFEMITINAGGEAVESKIGNVKVYRLFKKFGPLQKLLFPFAAARKAATLHAERQYDATWSIMASYAGYAGYIFKRKHPTVPMILTIQEGDHFKRRSGLLKPLFRRIFRVADRVTVISRFLREWSVKMGAKDIPGKNPVIVNNGVDIDLFSRRIGPEQRTEMRLSLGFEDDDVILVTASRLVYKNSTETIIESLKSLEPRVKLLILGAGPDEKMLRDMVDKDKLGGRVVFKGFVPHSDLPEYLKASEIFVRPSRTEGLGNSFLEAMAAGIPVIATPVGGIPDFLTDGETGLFCEVNNPQSIVQKVEKLIKDRESRDYIINNAKNMVTEEYSWDVIFGRMKLVLQENI